MTGRRPTCSGGASSSSPGRAASARAPSPRRWRCSRPSTASGCSSSRSTPRATSPTASSRGRSASSPARCIPGVFALAMDTEASLREYLKLNLKVPVVGRLGPLARVLDFVATAAPGVKEVLTIGKVCWEVREAIEGRADWDLVARRRRGDRPRDRAARRARGDPRARRRRPGALADRVDDRDPRTIPRSPRSNVVATPEEMPVEETIDLVGRAREELEVAARRRDREPGAARAVHPRRRGDVRRAARARRRPRS